ncbi:DUF4388 domain-containing protein, partial [bacterium]|nr:DUF4388 domain-containing protein [bacterium]
SSRYKDRLGAMLLRMGCITEEQFNDVFSRQVSNGRPLGEIFISENLVEEEELQSILTLQAEEIIFDLVSWENGDFSFEERKLDNEEERLNPVVISNLLLEGARRMDEIRRIRSFINDKYMVFKLKSGNSVDDTNLSRPENVITKFLVSPMSLGDIFKLVNETEYSILTALCSLLNKEIIFEDEQASSSRRQVQEKLNKLMEMTELMEKKGWYHEALSNLEEILSKEPGNAKGKRMKKRLEAEILKHAKLIFKSLDDIPTVRYAVASIGADKLMLTAHEGFVFSRIDGKTDVKNLRYLTGLPKDDLCVVLHKFIRMGLIFLEKNKRKVSSVRR